MSLAKRQRLEGASTSPRAHSPTANMSLLVVVPAEAQDVARTLLAPDGVAKLVAEVLGTSAESQPNYAAQLDSITREERLEKLEAVVAEMIKSLPLDSKQIEEDLATVWENFTEAEQREDKH